MRKLLSFVLFSLIALVSTAQDKQHYCPQFVVGQYVSYDYAASLNWQHSPYWLFNDVEFMFSLNMFDGELHNNFSLKVLETDADSTTFELDITKIAAPNNFTFEADKQLIEQIQQIFNRIKPIVKVEWKAQQWLLVNQTDLLFGFYDFLKSQVPNKNVSKEEFIEELKNLPTEMVKAVFLSFCPGFDAWLKAYWQPYAMPVFEFKTMKHSETTQENVDKYCRMNGSAYVSDDKTLHIEVDIETARERYDYSGPIEMKDDSIATSGENTAIKNDNTTLQVQSLNSVTAENKPALYFIQRHRILNFATDSWVKSLTDNVNVKPDELKSTANIVLKRN
ncbi:hypothetical protein [Prevotella pallens]|uniref:hypothetical protein n=1 Tax=Prevotella pallens TaxID=60133 RepID=UPI001CB3F151|nr:hypothetical protein [Prevotella pallens]MBF1501442.1 hypothetical protein [Prevotella pallens]